MTTGQPLITVLMPAFNAGRFLRPAVESVLVQSCGDLELLLIDDGSSDEGLASLATVVDSRLRLVRNDSNLGLVATLNRGVGMARGRYLARMDADDLSCPERLELQVNYLERHQEVGICSTWAQFIDEQDGRLGLLKTPVGKDLETFFWRPSPLVHAAVMARTELLRSYPYDAGFADAEDYELWLRMYDRTRFHNISRPLYCIRRHPGSVSATRRERQLRNSHLALCRFLGHDRIDYPTFLALLDVDCRLPLRGWLVAYRAVSQRTGWTCGRFTREFRDYVRLWLSHARSAR